MIKLSDYVFERVAEAGVRHVFMLPGGGCMHLVDSLGRSPRLRYVCNLHEQACAVAAEAYGQYTNNLGVALVTTGPGATNTLTGVVAAWLDSTPCLFLSGQVKREDLGAGKGLRQFGFQEINIVDIVRPVTKYAVTVTEPEQVAFHVDQALWWAREGRPGPVWIDIPLDVQAARIDERALARFEPPKPMDGGRDLSAKVREAIHLLNRSQRPIVLVGNGVRLAGAADGFLELIESCGLPVLTTWKAMDLLPEDHACYVGRPGAIGQRAANFAQQNSDFILILGARLDTGQTAYNHANFARAARKVMVDADPAEIAKMRTTIDVAIAADAGAVIREFLRQLPAVEARDRSSWWDRCRDWRARYPVVLPEYRSESDGVNVYALVEALSQVMTGEDLFVPGSSGACSEVTMQAFEVKRGQRVFNSEGLGPMGFGVPAAIGGCLASDLRRTVCVDGDGGFHMNSQELETVRRLQLPIKFFVLDNDGYASIRSTQRAYFESRFVGSSRDSGLTLPDIARIAAAYGIPTARIERTAEVRQGVRDALETHGPVVCVVAVSPNQVTAPRVSSRQRSDGTMESAPMEDLWPFLERDEFEAMMIVPPPRP